MASYLINIASTMDVESSFSKWGKGHVSREMSRLVTGMGLGTHSGSLDVQRDSSFASGVLLLSGGAGSVGGTIGGKAVTATFATSDANTCDLVAAAIIADATANQYVTAVSRAATGTVTISSGSGVITATINGRAVSVTWASTDTATATALAAAINADSLNACIASSSAGVVTVWARPGFTAGGPSVTATGATNTGGNSITLAASGTGTTASGAVLSGGGTNANVVVVALVPGTIGNGVTLAASGTGMSAPSGARLVGGVGAPGNTFTV